MGRKSDIDIDARPVVFDGEGLGDGANDGIVMAMMGGVVD